MPTVRARLLPVLALVALVPATRAAGQQQRPLLTPTVTQYGTIYLSDPRLISELKVTTEQAKKLEPVVAESFLDFSIARRDADRRAQLSRKQDEKLAAILTPDQQTRLKQLVLQQLARLPSGPEIFGGDADLVKRLSLSDEQVKRLKERQRLADVLNAEQRKTWAELTGPEFSEWLVVRGTVGLPFSHSPVELRALYHDNVSRALKLSDAQEARVEELLWLWGSVSLEINDRYTLDHAMTEFADKALALLTAEQRARFLQVVVRSEMRARGERSVYGHPRVVAQLKLGAAQQKQLITLLHERRKDLLGLFVTGATLSELKQRLKEHEAETDKRLTAALSPEQNKQLTELRGPPEADLLAESGVAQLPFARGWPHPKSFLAAHAFFYITLPDIHTRLKADAKQAKQLSDLPQELGLPRGSLFAGDNLSEAERRKQAAAIDKRLTEILTPAQVRSLKQLTLRNYPLYANLHGPAGVQLLALDELTATVKLAPAQLRRLLRGAFPRDVLDADQQKAWEELIGPTVAPPKVTAPQVQIGRTSPYPYASLTLTQLAIVTNSAVANELKLSEQQKQALAEAVKPLPGVRQLPPMPFDAAGEKTWFANLEKQGRAVMPNVVKVLDESQQRRLRQLALQQCTRFTYPRSLPVYQLAEVGAELKMTPEQIKKVADWIEEQRQVTLLLYSLPPVDFARSDDGRYQTVSELSNVYAKKMQELLTPEQKMRETELLGKPYPSYIPLR